MAEKDQSPLDLGIGKKMGLHPIFEKLRSSWEVEHAVQALCRLEPRFEAIVKLHGMPALRALPQGLEGLLMIITDQFLSLQAGAAIWLRLKARLGDCTTSGVLGCSELELVGLGLSRAKARAFHAAAQADLDFTNLDTAVIANKLCLIRGVGPWTADIYLLSVLGAADAWPAGDLALRIAIADFLALPQKPEISEMALLAVNWRPWRAVAARLLWSHYRGLKGLQQA
jgi:DNA-3-methyladenine glycosylase II